MVLRTDFTTFLSWTEAHMNLVLTGSLGHIGRPLTEELVQKGHRVTVISSKPERRQEIETLGAKAAIGSVTDVDFLSRTFQGADAVYTMLPPGDYSDPNLDLMVKVRQIGATYSQAIEAAGVKRVVHLSSIGAHLDKGSGLIILHHEMELILDKLKDVAITFMRPTGFYYNLYGYVEMVKRQGVIAANYGEEDRVVWASPIDIAAAVAEELVAPRSGRQAGKGAARAVRYVASDELTCSETARILGEAIGKPDLRWIIIPGEQMQAGLVAAGIQPSIAAGLVEMYAAHHSGALAEDYHRNRPSLGRVKMRDFAREFAAVFNPSEVH